MKNKTKQQQQQNQALGGRMTFWVTQMVNGSPQNTQPKSQIQTRWGKIDKAFQSIVLFIMFSYV